MGSEMIKTIEQSLQILNLKHSWDDEGALPIQFGVWYNMSSYLLGLVKDINQEWRVKIEAPEINPCPDGSIDLSWRNSKSKLLINITDSFVSYFGTVDSTKKVKNKYRFDKTDNLLDKSLTEYLARNHNTTTNIESRQGYKEKYIIRDMPI